MKTNEKDRRVAVQTPLDPWQVKNGFHVVVLKIQEVELGIIVSKFFPKFDIFINFLEFFLKFH